MKKCVPNITICNMRLSHIVYRVACVVLLLLCIAMLMSACCRKYVAPTIIEKTIIKDSIVEIIRDSIISIPPDTAWLKALLACDSLGQVYIKQLLEYEAGKNIKPPSIIIKENVLTALSYTDSMNIYMALKDRYRHTVTDNVKYEKEVVEVNRLTKLQGFWIILGRIFGGLVLAFVAWRAYKIFRK